MSARDEAVGALIDRALSDYRKSGTTRRHPAEVTADRVGQATIDFRHLMSGAEADAFATVIQVLTEIAEGERR